MLSLIQPSCRYPIFLYPLKLLIKCIWLLNNNYVIKRQKTENVPTILYLKSLLLKGICSIKNIWCFLFSYYCSCSLIDYIKYPSSSTIHVTFVSVNMHSHGKCECIMWQLRSFHTENRSIIARRSIRRNRSRMCITKLSFRIPLKFWQYPGFHNESIALI